jgi:hypothetical protein
MSFATGLHSFLGKVDPAAKPLNNAMYSLLKPKTPPKPPGVPNPNDAANAAQGLTDSMRMRRGLLSNIYAGGQAGAGSQPVTGNQQLGV